MKSPGKFRSLLALPAILLLALAGCRPDQPIDAAQYNQADWEKRLNDPSLTEKEFTRLYALAVAHNFMGCTVRITGTREVTIKSDDGGQLKAFLDNAWQEVSQPGADRPEICRRYIQALMNARFSNAGPAGPPDTNSIVAVIRDDLFLQQYEKMGTTKTNRLVSEPLVADLHVVYVSDREGAIVYLSDGDRTRLGLELPALRQLALTNLQRILPPLKEHRVGPFFAIQADGNYDSSLLLLDGLWNEKTSRVEGELVAAVPSRGILLFGGSRSSEDLKTLRRMVDQFYAEDSHTISKTLLVRRNGRWEKFSD